jgi:hypothetical protein
VSAAVEEEVFPVVVVEDQESDSQHDVIVS